ncbi:MAG: cysteinyl-tRNA synthetase [Patescibacteria group bacterium]|nr:cysteinyl-tRNA synthetase [Patescibacteria group bacterium]
MDLKFYNTLTKKIEQFSPISDNKVGMYNCGPTVYNYAHIGNLRAYIFADVLRKTLELSGYEVTQVINVTDIGHLSGDGDDGEDKMSKALKREGKPMTLQAMREVADFYFEKFKEDLNSLNITPATHFPFASDHIAEDVEMVNTLLEKGSAYKTSDGIYFDTATFPSYGALGGVVSLDGEHSRIGVNDEKKNPRDFAIWKWNDELGYEAPFGKGFPGWHIECSAMSRKYLGDTFDIHTGGIDHIPVHHNNEIAQSESVTGVQYVKYWLHSDFINIGEDKMAKSGENFITLRTLIDKGFNPIAYRLWVLGAHYKTVMNFKWESLEGTSQALKRLYSHVRALKNAGIGNVHSSYKERFETALSNDLNTADAVATLWELLKDTEVSKEDKYATALYFDKVLGLGLGTISDVVVPENILELVNQREDARKEKDWATSDMLRDQISTLGFEINDTPDGPDVEVK